ncbi:hypothetical protein [Bordetella phage vB_BbrM_PHB04]|uniref:Uncharacterized protein n=1 Tax=Bordetella phage vB_BbrM_PHB04 TaxID=2029657 RepID=A0A291LA57_9CAUD|nr:hypothetical protein HOS14_gp075 [Bordetella phage vB_BbrM_PHB04]ATI15693.1 hypothetical protein [Bordetella phage vB_BbrM_PHB04]
MTPRQRRDWILAHMRERPRESFDVLNSDFVYAYAEATDAPVALQMFGAPKCQQLGRDLGELHKRGHLKRNATGLPAGDSSMGFPKWVYCYRLRAIESDYLPD